MEFLTGKKERCEYCVEYNGDCVEESGGFDYYSCELKNKEDLEKYGAKQIKKSIKCLMKLCVQY